MVVYTLEDTGKAIASMDDGELVRRWVAGLFSDEARPLAEAEMERRQLDSTLEPAGNAVPRGEPGSHECIHRSVEPANEAARAGAPAAARLDRIEYLPGWRPSTPALAVADDGWQDTAPAPWRRYFARMLDTTLLGLLVWLGISQVVAAIDPVRHDVLFGEGSLLHNRLVDIVVTFVTVIPVLVLLIGLTGASPGKWLFGVRVTRRDGRPLGLRHALKRELAVFARGLGFGLPLVSLVTLVLSHRDLADNGVSKWDERRPWVVTHRPAGVVQVTLAIVGVAAWVSLRVYVHAL